MKLEQTGFINGNRNLLYPEIPFFLPSRAYRDPTVPITQYNGLCHVTLYHTYPLGVNHQPYRFFQYYLSISPNNVINRHKYWSGVVKMSALVRTDGTPNTQSLALSGNGLSDFEIRPTTSSSGVWWLNFWVYTSAYCESIICILH